MEWMTSLPKNRSMFCEIDVLNAESLDKAISESEKKFGGFDACINLAYPKSESWGKKFEEISSEEIYNHLNQQLGSCILISQKIIKYFLLRGNGNLILVSSIQGFSAPKFEHYENTDMSSPAEYTAAKSGIIGIITKWLAKYCKNKNIRVNCVSPGGIKNNQEQNFLDKYNATCMSKGMLDAEDISGIIGFLISENSKYINGQNIVIDDGWSL